MVKITEETDRNVANDDEKGDENGKSTPSTKESSSRNDNMQKATSSSAMKTTTTTTTTTTATATAQIVFVRLDPILRRLLKNVTELRTSYCDTKNDDDDDDTNSLPPSPLSSLYHLIDNIVKDLNELSKHLRSFSVGKDGASSPSDYSFVPSLILLADYVTLPLTAIFHLQLQYKQGSSNNNNTTAADDRTTIERQRQIRQTYVRKLYETTARTIQIYVESTSTTTTRTTRRIRLKSQYLIKYLIALTSALPAYNEIERITTTIRTTTTTTSNPNDNIGNSLLSGCMNESSSSPSSLDDGSNLWVTLLEVITSIIHFFKEDDEENRNESSSSSSSSSDLLLLDAWHGTLLMRIIDCITAFLICKAGSFVFPPYVHTETLDLLLCIQQSLSREASLSFWRSVFPGVFTALYQRIVGTTTIVSTRNDRNHHHKRSRHNEERYLSSIETKSLQSLIMLLKSTLPSSSQPSSTKDDASSGGEILTQLISMANRSNRKTNSSSNNNNKTDNRLDNNQGDKIIDDDEIFVRQVQKRVVGPLIVVLKQRAISQSVATREEVISLCHVILLDTVQCWKQRYGDAEKVDGGTDTSSEGIMDTQIRGSIEEVAFEICIALQRDPDGT
jgi:hypothetical protein